MKAQTPQIEVDEKPDPALRDAILKPLRAYNESKIGPIKIEPLAVTLKDPETGAVVGGLWGIVAVDWLYIDLLAVPERFYGQGLGRQLLNRAEEVARERGCIGMWLYTAAFQAPAFYEKLGFARFGELPDYAAGHANIYYAKRLDR